MIEGVANDVLMQYLDLDQLKNHEQNDDGQEQIVTTSNIVSGPVTFENIVTVPIQLMRDIKWFMATFGEAALWARINEKVLLPTKARYNNKVLTDAEDSGPKIQHAGLPDMLRDFFKNLVSKKSNLYDVLLVKGKSTTYIF